MGRVYVEMLFLIPVFIIEVLLLERLYSTQKAIRTQSVAYGMAVGVGLSMKMTFLPFVFLPFFILERKKEWARYLLALVLTFFISSLTVLVQFRKFLYWMGGLFMHNGTYQGGAKTVIDAQLFVLNIQKIFYLNPWLFFIALILLVFVVLQVIRKRDDRILKRINLGILTVLAGFIFIAGKHFEVRYFIAAELMFPLLLILIHKNIETRLTGRTYHYFILFILVTMVGYRLSKVIPYARIVSRSVEQQVTAREQTRNAVSMLSKDSYQVIVSQDYGSPFKAYAIMYAFCMGGKNWPGRDSQLSELFPNTYQFFTWDNTLKFWGIPFDPDAVIQSGKPLYIYLEKDNEALYQRTLHKLLGEELKYNIEKKPIFINKNNLEAVYQLILSRK